MLFLSYLLKVKVQSGQISFAQEMNTEIKRANRGASKSSSSLSHEFYQVMVGDPRMTIHGWKQLAEWSIEHSCLSTTQIAQGKEIHAREWEAFCKWVVSEYGDYVKSLDTKR